MDFARDDLDVDPVIGEEIAVALGQSDRLQERLYGGWASQRGIGHVLRLRQGMELPQL